MDYTTLISQIQKNHKLYESEFLRILNTYHQSISLPLTTNSNILSLITFLSTVSHFYDSEYPNFLLLHLNSATDFKLKKELINNLFIIKHKKLVDDHLFFKNILLHCDLQKILHKVVIEIREPRVLISLFSDYLHKGDEKQMAFSIYMICYIYEKYRCKECEEIIKNGFFKEQKVQNICILYLLNEIDFNKGEKSRYLQEVGIHNGKEIIKFLFKEVKRKKESRDVRIKKLECIDIIKKEYSIDFDISDFLFQMIDPSKEDLQVLMELLVDNLNGNIKIVDKMIKMFCTEYKDDDFIVYGLNFLKEVCLRNDFGDLIKEKTDIFNKHKSAAVNVAYRGMIKAIKLKISDNKEILYVKKKKTKEEKKEMSIKDSEEKKKKRLEFGKKGKNKKKGRKRGKRN